ncbi:MAG: sigma factor-like helix-turn-helix DNA-binding protein [Tissierellia bacterium]|nr:sigma factor-like helix-turn-helix DNA-binding protein [Tissierellia bacterium]
MEKIVRVGILFSFYKSLLTKKQRDVINWYFNEDLSLNEIADLTDKSKQAVSDMILRTVNKLEQFDKNLDLINKNQKQLDNLLQIRQMLLDNKEKTEIIDLLDKMIEKV